MSIFPNQQEAQGCYNGNDWLYYSPDSVAGSQARLLPMHEAQTADQQYNFLNPFDVPTQAFQANHPDTLPAAQVGVEYDDQRYLPQMPFFADGVDAHGGLYQTPLQLGGEPYLPTAGYPANTISLPDQPTVQIAHNPFAIGAYEGHYRPPSHLGSEPHLQTAGHFGNMVPVQHQVDVQIPHHPFIVGGYDGHPQPPVHLGSEPELPTVGHTNHGGGWSLDTPSQAPANGSGNNFAPATGPFGSTRDKDRAKPYKTPSRRVPLHHPLANDPEWVEQQRALVESTVAGGRPWLDSDVPILPDPLPESRPTIFHAKYLEAYAITDARSGGILGYFCPECHRALAVPSTFKAHFGRRDHGAAVIEYPCAASDCSRKYSKPSNRNRHERKHHGYDRNAKEN